MAVLFLEPGSDATFDTSFWTVAGTVTSDAGQAHTGPRSLKFDSTAGDVLASVTKDTICAANGRLSLWVYLTHLPTAGSRSIVRVNPSNLASFVLQITTGGVLQMVGAAQLGSNGSTLSPGQWYHLAVVWTVTSTTVNTVKLFLGSSSSPDITATNGTLTASATTGRLQLGWLALGPGASKVINFDDLYLDDASTLDNPGEILVTAKKPAQGWASGFDTIIGATPANRADNVNQRASSDTDGYAQGPLSQIARPFSDITVTGWTFTGGATAAAVTQEVVTDDATYADRASTGTLEIRFDPLDDPVSSVGHVLTVRMGTDGGGGAEAATIALYQGSTAIATSSSFQPARAFAYADVTLTLTGGQADAITDYTDLRVRVVITTGGGAEHFRVTQAYFTCPYPAITVNESYLVDAPQGGDVNMTGGQIVGRMGWVRAKRTAAGSASLLFEASLNSVSLTTSPAIYVFLDAIDRFPAITGNVIGLRATVDFTETTTLYECGFVLAYLAGSGTKLYLRLEDSPYSPYAGSQSATLPVGTANLVAAVEGRLRTSRGATAYPLAATTLAQTGQQSGYLARFTSGALNAQTISANTWTMEFQSLESNASANAFLRVVLYVWRPSTGAVVGYVYDGAADLGAEWGTTRSGQVVTFAGSSVATAGGDSLVLEVWSVATQAAGTAYTVTFDFDGKLGITAGTTATDAATALSTPQVLSFATEAAATGRRFYLTNSLAPVQPSVGDQSTALPFGTFAITASGTDNERRFMDTPTPVTAQVTITFNSLAQSARQDGYLSRWSSRLLEAQTLALQTWTVALGVSEADARANTFYCVSLYAWRPATAARVGYLFDSSQALGTEWATAEQGRVQSFTGNALAIARGDILVLEVWFTALQQNGAIYSHGLSYGGATPPTQATATADAASYVEATQDLIFMDVLPPFDPRPTTLLSM